LQNKKFVKSSPLITEQIEYVPDSPDDSQHNIRVATWNVNTHARTANELQYFFSEKLDRIQPKIFVLALQVVDNSNSNFCPDKIQNSVWSQNMARTSGS